jgi:cyclophilin family peptidyl-prolyl cis-trans isomerase
MILFAHGNEEESFTFSLTADNRLKLTTQSDGRHNEYLSKQMGPLPTNDFTRVIMSYELFENVLRFYAGTKDITDDEFIGWVLQDDAAPLRFGAGLNGENPFHGNMMEVRIWTKALSPAEIANTHLRRLTGYEHGLLAYYPMSESKGDTMDDLASGATLIAKGLSWTNPQGISLATNGTKVRLQPTLFSRTEAEDYTLMGWFRSDNSMRDEVSLFGTAVGDSVTMQLSLHDGTIRFTAGDVDAFASADLTDGNWHHCVLVISKTYNSGTLYIDNQLILMFPTIGIGALSGTSVWLADGLEGNIDDVCLFEQALPAELIAEFGKQTPNGEEMGLINLLTFSRVKRNASGIMEQVFSADNQRVFRDANGNVVNKVQPLLVDDLTSHADKSNYAPVRDRGLLTNLPFNWTYQESELLINIKTQPREINKRTMYLTVRDVEDLNGNRLPSPVMWTVYANLNSIVWSERSLQIVTDFEQSSVARNTITIANQTGMTRQYTIDHLPTWLSVSPAQGTLEAEDEKTVTFTVKEVLKPGLHNHVVYLTDDQGLSEPLLIEVEVTTECPYDEPETSKFPYNMSLCGQVKIGDVFDSDPNDKVIALCNNECVGMANVDFDNVTNKSNVFITVFGKEEMNGKPIQFRLWQASTDKVYDLSADRDIVFAHGAVYGCGDSEPVSLTTNGNERQTIKLDAGWNWTSFNLDLRQYVAKIDQIMTADQPWTEGDLMKNPATRHFTIYSDSLGRFIGDFDYLRYIYTYMIYSQEGNTMHISGNNLPADSMYVIVAGDGQWSALPCLLRDATPIQKAMADYYDHASSGDLIKAHNRFAYFSEDKKWVGDLTALRPSEGYFLRRLAPGDVKIRFFNQESNSASGLAAKRSNSSSGLTGGAGLFSNPNAATNMTMIAKMDNGEWTMDNGQLMVFVNDELAAVAAPMSMTNDQSPMTNDEVFYFLTIQSDQVGKLRFELNGETLMPIINDQSSIINYEADTHHGTLKSPVLLRPAENNRPYKILENDHVVIIRNNEKYDVTGKKL